MRPELTYPTIELISCTIWMPFYTFYMTRRLEIQFWHEISTCHLIFFSCDEIHLTSFDDTHYNLLMHGYTIIETEHCIGIMVILWTVRVDSDWLLTGNPFFWAEELFGRLHSIFIAWTLNIKNYICDYK